MRGVRPLRVEELGQDGVLGLRLDHGPPVVVVGERLLRREEARPHPGAGRSQHERRGEPAAVGDAACRDDRHDADRIDDGGDERHRGCLAPHVAPRLDTLGHHDVDA